MKPSIVKWLYCFSITCLLFAVPLLHAGTTGKLSGRVVDSGTGEPLPGANVIVEGTTMGAAADADGYFFIINIPPGAYAVRASMIGYEALRQTELRVTIDHTTPVDFSLKSSVVEGEEVTIVSEQEVVQMDRSSSEISASAAEITETVSVKSVGDFINQQVGVGSDFEIRGGSLDQTQFMVNGLTVVDNRRGQPMMMVNLSAIEELNIVKGGFNAEYGNVRSGLINVVTKSGSSDRYDVSLDSRLTPARVKHGGEKVTSPKNWYLRPYLDTGLEGTASWSQEMIAQHREFEGWTSLAAKDPLLTAEQARDLYLWRHAAEGSAALGQKEITYGDKPDYYIDGSVSGPVPGISRALGNLTFFASHRTNRDAFAVPVLRDYFGDDNTQLKLTSRLSHNMKLSVEGILNKVSTIANQSGHQEPYGSGAEPMFETSGWFWDHLYWQGTRVPFDTDRSMLGLSLDHALSPNTFYSIRVAAVEIEDHANEPSNDPNALSHYRDPSAIVRSFGGVNVTEEPYGYRFDRGHLRSVDNQVYEGGGADARDSTVVKSINVKFDITSQMDRFNQIKVGVDLTYDDMKVNTDHIRADLTTQNSKRKWSQTPYRLGAYVQNKLEFQGMIANLGLRLDWNNPNSDWYLTDDIYSDFFTVNYRNTFEDVAPKRSVKGKVKLSPRLGISHPISDVSKLYFNYGHFYSLPVSRTMYEIDLGSPSSGVNFLGNPEAELPRTIAYELGYEHEIADSWHVQVQGYYKDVTNQTGNSRFTNLDASVDYTTTQNNNFADVRGFELSLRKRYGRWVTGWLNYDFRVESSGFVGRERNYQSLSDQRRLGLIDPNDPDLQEKPLVRPAARAQLLFHSPRDLQQAYLREWQLGLLFSYQAGEHFTYDPQGTNEVRDNVQWAPFYNLDLRLSKSGRISGIGYTVFADVLNVLNLQLVHPYTGFGDLGGSGDDALGRNSLDFDAYMRSLHLPIYDNPEFAGSGLIAGDDRPGDKRSDSKPYINMPNRDFLTFLAPGPRYVEFGLRINF